MTEAQKYLQARQPPLGGGIDPILLLLGILTPELSSQVKGALDSGQLAIGRVHDMRPMAVTEDFDDGSVVVGISNGLLDCVYAFARVIGLLQTVHGPDGTTSPTFTRTEAVAEIRRLFGLYKAGGLVGHGGQPATRDQLIIADELARFAEATILAHELGHVAERFDPSFAGESGADRFAAQTLLAVGRRRGYRMVLMGAFFAHRMYALMQRFEVGLDDDHPPALARANRFIEEATAHFGGRAAMMAKLSMTIALDEFVEALENEAAGKGITSEQTPLRVGIRLRAMLEEAARGRLPMSRLPEELVAGSRGVPAEMLAAAVRDFRDDVQSDPLPDGVTSLAALAKVISQLPAPLQAVFQNGLGSPPSHAP